ncbi:hypothetical protein CBP12_12835 [Oceanisphaera avium]|uniref:Capsular biosynthesis protein n=2 Tax=Oceanisphaera avium TaxID=1903694 RepID=A0A1Y0D030_9GAMM|nr:hypothetical protein CBP12_12835 [Oceanisphaera avium]
MMLFTFKRKVSLIFCLVGNALYCNSAIAITPNAVDLNGVYFTPILTLNETYDDNIWNASGIEGDPVQASWVTTIQPQLNLSAIDRLNVYEIDYRLKHSEYHSKDDENKTEHFLSTSADMEFTTRHRLKLSAKHTKQQEDRDSTNRNPLNNESANKYQYSELAALYGFGAKAAKMYIDLGLEGQNYKYLNNRYSASQTHLRDHDTLSALIRANYNYSAKTRFILETQYSDYSYKSSNLDNEVWRYLAGVNWQPSAKLGTLAKFGVQDKTFSDAGIDDASNQVWEAAINWSPKTYSLFTLSTSNKTEEGSATESFINTDQYNIAWQHEWLTRLVTNLKYTFEKNKYGLLNDLGTARQDDVNKYLVSISYAFRNWLGFELGYEYVNQNSNFDINSYDRNQIYLNTKMSL